MPDGRQLSDVEEAPHEERASMEDADPDSGDEKRPAAYTNPALSPRYVRVTSVGLSHERGPGPSCDGARQWVSHRWACSGCRSWPCCQGSCALCSSESAQHGEWHFHVQHAEQELCLLVHCATICSVCQKNACPASALLACVPSSGKSLSRASSAVCACIDRGGCWAGRSGRGRALLTPSPPGARWWVRAGWSATPRSGPTSCGRPSTASRPRARCPSMPGCPPPSTRCISTGR